MPEKPTLMWHADGEGRCHRGCEARREDPQGTWYCVICNLFPWTTFRGPAGDGVLCPFALLASVLCCGKKEETQGELTAEQLERICGVAYGYKNDMMQGNCLQLVHAVLREAKRCAP